MLSGPTAVADDQEPQDYTMFRKWLQMNEDASPLPITAAQHSLAVCWLFEYNGRAQFRLYEQAMLVGCKHHTQSTARQGRVHECKLPLVASGSSSPERDSACLVL